MGGTHWAIPAAKFNGTASSPMRKRQDPKPCLFVWEGFLLITFLFLGPMCTGIAQSYRANLSNNPGYSCTHGLYKWPRFRFPVDFYERTVPKIRVATCHPPRGRLVTITTMDKMSKMTIIRRRGRSWHIADRCATTSAMALP